MSKVSVIIPVYNVEKYLKKCLDSVINQTLKDIEIICINDCSTDNSLEILKEYALSDNGIKIIDFKENKGVSCARNEGIKVAKGEYIGFVDSDDYIDLDFYEKLYNKAKETNAEIVKAQMTKVFPEANKITGLNKEISNNKINFVGEFYSAIYLNDFLKSNNLYFPETVLTFEDPIFSVNVVLHNKTLEIINDTNYYYFVRPDSKVRTYSKRKAESFVEGVKILISILNQNQLKKEDYIFLYYRIILRTFFKRFRNDNISKSDYDYLFAIFQKVLVDNLKYQDEIQPKRTADELFKSNAVYFNQRNILQTLRTNMKLQQEIK